ncbi:MAG: hypothetical protein M1831_006674 [Alyxoria varia]|nr:MAG: hypothetical protein M1831_006674 [Alyxoria varia]
MSQQDFSGIISKHRPSLDAYEDYYRDFHRNPELSHAEDETVETILEHLQELANKAKAIGSGISVENIRSIGGTGLCSVIRNGSGPTILLRADMDALPVAETTGLPYASGKRMPDPKTGDYHPVMHACGHDMHMTSLLAAGQLLLSAHESWNGTLILLFQPAEEKGAGAQGMIDDGLYDSNRHKVPVPDVVLGAHVLPLRAGTVFTRGGDLMSASDSLKITLYGRGGHASRPQTTVDPVVMASYIITRLQTVVAREIGPQEHVVVSVASLHAGQAENVIPETAELKVNIRSFTPDTRKRAIEAVKRIVSAESSASKATKPPEYETLSSYPVLENDKDCTAKLAEGLGKHFGPMFQLLQEALPAGSEDFGILGSGIDKSYVYWGYGGTDPELWDRKSKEGRILEDIPFNHSSNFAPVIQPTLRAGCDSYAVAALTWLVKE